MLNLWGLAPWHPLVYGLRFGLVWVEVCWEEVAEELDPKPLSGLPVPGGVVMNGAPILVVATCLGFGRSRQKARGLFLAPWLGLWVLGLLLCGSILLHPGIPLGAGQLACFRIVPQ